MPDNFLPGPGESMNTLSKLPSVDRLLSEPQIAVLVVAHGRDAVRDIVRAELAAARERIRNGAAAPDNLLGNIAERVAAAARPKLKRVFNLTGTVLHTNLGRAPLPEEAVAALVMAARSPCALEYDVDSGGRGDRDDIVDELLCELTGAEAATVGQQQRRGRVPAYSTPWRYARKSSSRAAN